MRNPSPEEVQAIAETLDISQRRVRSFIEQLKFERADAEQTLNQLLVAQPVGAAPSGDLDEQAYKFIDTVFSVGGN